MENRTKHERWVEVGVVLIVALLPEYYSIVASLFQPGPGVPRASFSSSLGDCLGEIIKHLSLSAIPLYLIWRSGESRHRFGFTRPRWMLDTCIAVGVLFINYLVVSGGSLLLPGPSHFENYWEDPNMLPATGRHIAEDVLSVIDTGVGAFYEELLMRAYLIPRFEELLRSTWASLFLTAFLFAGFHLDQGVANVLNTMVAGLVYGGAFCLFRRLWPIVTAHAVYNLTVSLLPWL